MSSGECTACGFQADDADGMLSDVQNGQVLSVCPNCFCPCLEDEESTNPKAAAYGNKPEDYFIQTYTGKTFFLADPTVDMVDLEDIAHSLSMQCRFLGHCRFFYSVAQHSVFVSNYAPKGFEREGLLHDAAEAYFGDIVSPWKWLIGKESQWTAYRNRIKSVVYERFGLNPSGKTSPEIQRIDLKMLATERRDLMNEHYRLGEESWIDLPEPYKTTVKSVDPREAKQMFFQAAVNLGVQ